MHQTCSLAMKTMNVLPYTSTSFTCRLQTHTPQKANVPSLRQQCPPHIHSSRRRLGVSRLIGFVESCGPFVERLMLHSRSLLLRFSVSCIVVAVLGYGMMSMYWCCRCRLNRFLLDLCRIFATTSPFTIMRRILDLLAFSIDLR